MSANNALRLDGWETEVDPFTKKVSARYLPEPASCPRCGSVDAFRRHGRKITKIYDTPVEGLPAPFEAHIQRYRCLDCGGTSMQPLPHVDTKHRMLTRCADYIANQCRDRPFVELARDIGVDDKTIRNVCFARFGRKLHERAQRPIVMLGIDEVYVRFKGTKGRKRKCSVFSDIGRGSGYVDLIDTGSVNLWLAHKLPQREQTLLVVMDMADPYRTAVRAILPNARIVVDRFHVAKKVNEALDAVRNSKRRKDLVAAEAVGVRLAPLKRRDRNILQLSRHKLSARLWLRLDGILKNNPLFKAAWDAKESFYDIWDATDRQDAERRFDAWKANIPPLVEVWFRDVADTVERWREEVFLYFTVPVTNAYTESLNRLVKDMNREGRGYSFRNIRAKAVLRERKVITIICDTCERELPYKRVKTIRLKLDPTVSVDEPMVVARCKKCSRRTHTEEETNAHGVSP